MEIKDDRITGVQNSLTERQSLIYSEDVSIDGLRRRDVFDIIRFLEESRVSNFDGTVHNLNNLILVYRKDADHIRIDEADREIK